MKKTTLFATLLFITAVSVSAGNQNTSIGTHGIYLTVQDFLHHHLSYANGEKIVLNQFTDGPNIKVIEKGEKKIIPKKEVFGYHDNSDKDYRFYHNELFEIVTAEPWFIYKHYASATAEGKKGFIKKEFYYFSIKGTDELIPLTVENLKKAFPENLKFHDLLDQVRNDDDLTRYDSYRKELMIGYLYTKSL